MTIEALTVASATTGDLTPAEARHFTALERRIERGLSTFREVGESLLEIRDKRLFRLTHTTFESYCRERWHLERGRAYQLMGAAEVFQALPAGAQLVNEAQARELAPLLHGSPGLVEKVWAKVASGDGPITAPRIREAVREATGQNGKDHATSPTTALVALIERAANDLERWRKDKHTPAEKRAVQEALARLVQ